jgi:hypothetical protein
LPLPPGSEGIVTTFPHRVIFHTRKLPVFDLQWQPNVHNSKEQYTPEFADSATLEDIAADLRKLLKTPARGSAFE